MSERKAAVGDTVRLKKGVRVFVDIGQVVGTETKERWGTRWRSYGHYPDWITNLRYEVLVDTSFGPVTYSLRSSDFDVVRRAAT